MVQNNIFYRNTGVNGIRFLSQDNKRHLVRNNIFFPSGNNLLPGGGEVFEAVDNLEIDPTLMDPTAFDFRLQDNSPAIDAGIEERAPVIDIAGRARPQGRQVDIGAHEFGLGDVSITAIVECLGWTK